MIPWGKAVGLGFLMWLIPFAVAFMAFPLREAARPVFESVMAVTVTGTAVGIGLAYLRRMAGRYASAGLVVGMLWFVMCVLIDAPLMLLGGPMQMSIGQYFGDIGLTYLIIPLVTWGLGAALAGGVRRAV